MDDLQSEPIQDRGFFGDGDRRAFADAHGPRDRYRTTVVVRRLAEGVFPVDVRVVFENGDETTWRWDGREPWKRFAVDRPVRAATAQVDPNRVLLLDVDFTNNSRTLTPRARTAARKWSLTWLIWLQDQLLTYGFFI